MKALLVHPGFDVIGGAEKVSLHIAQYLINEGWQVSMLSLMPPNLDEISNTTEFLFSADSLKIFKASCPRQIRGNSSLALIQMAFLHRAAKKKAKYYDLCISTYNELNFGKAGIQYIHHPYWPKRKLLHQYHTISNTNILDRYPILEKLYRFAAHSIAGNFSGFTENITLVNSDFIKDIVSSIYGIDSEVLYPGFLHEDDFVLTDMVHDPWQMVAISRITPDKNILELIRAFSDLSKYEPSAKLFIAGYAPNADYLISVKELIHQYGLHVELKIEVTRDEILSLLRKSRYFISTKKFEHFGISVLEAAANGCVPLVHKSGGVIEIVPYSEFQYNSFDEIPTRIIALNKNPKHLNELRNNLQRHIKKFDLSNFYKGLQAAVGQVITLD